jgi:hypothetical protein
VSSIPYALLLLCSSGLMILEEKRHKRLGKRFPTGMSAMVYQAIYSTLILLGVTTAFATTI